MVDVDGVRRASGAWLASRSQPAAPPVADFLTVAAMPGLTAAARAELHDWIQVKPHVLACMGQLICVGTSSATLCSAAGRGRGQTNSLGGKQLLAFWRLYSTVLHAPVSQALPRAPTHLLHGPSPMCP